MKCNQKAKENPRDQQEKMIFGSSQDPKKDKGVTCFIVDQPQSSNSKAQEVTSPLRPKLERKCKIDDISLVHDPSNSTQPKKKANLKKISKQGAQNQAQAQDTKMLASNVEVGKRPGTFESLEFEEIESKNAPSMLPPPPPPNPPLMVY